MTDRERAQFLKDAERFLKRIKSDKKAAQQLLINAGIFTPKGNLRKPYKNLCIPQDPA
jgi:hypothetical protein